MGGGSKTTEVKIPEWLEAAARENLARGQAVADIGYTPYYGPDVAAMTPMQMAAMQGTGSAAGAFGLPGGGMTGMEGMPSPQIFAGGVQGYSSGSLYDEAIAELQRRRPGQYDAITGMFIDPMTGALPITSFAPPVDTTAAMGAPAMDSNPASRSGDMGRDRDFTRGAPRSGGTGSFGLPDPMSGRITSVGPIGRDGGGGMGRGK
jgi:hypothetical protein